ncbi:MAG: hypothetical protein KGZ50_00545 [Peptococcaceae bacterium]|nr:hypothetical protein [Peptococcaceae bacterium]
MDAKRRARRVRTIIQVVELMDKANIRAWVGGGWAFLALDPAHQHDHSEIVFYLYAKDAAPARILLTEAGFSIVDIMPNSFVAMRGKLKLSWTLLWTDEQDGTITYDNRLDKSYLWPKDAFPREKNGLLEGVLVYALDPAACIQHLREEPGAYTGELPKDIKRLPNLKSLVHDRM